jgi:prolipoprotein diacylglyceryltransferase
MKTSTKVLHWLPRIICILTILFVSLFALDSLSDPTAFLIHLIPSFILLAILIIAWRWEKAGGIILTIAGLAWCVIVFQLNLRRTQSVAASLLIILMVCFPFVLAGILFLISASKKKKDMPKVN